ncbi:MAG: endopeptidase La [Clostridia bacterium]|nr:endopeptidase La [Clostridia bacterium]
MPRYIEKAEKITLPVIPTRGLVAFPSVPLSFEIEREVSHAALEAAKDTDMYVLLLCQKNIDCEAPTPNDLFDVGCVCRIKQSHRSPEGITRIIAEGVCRAKTLSFTGIGSCMFADVMTKTVSLEQGESDIRSEALLREATTALEAMLAFVPADGNDILVAAKSIKNPGQAADFIASSALVKYEDKQKVLEVFEPLSRLETLVVIIESETKLLALEMSIHKKVREAIDDNQRDYYLREQLKVIQGELGADSEDEAEEYYDKIDAQDFPKEITDKLYKEVSRLAKSPFGSPEAAVLRNYLDICLEIPFTKYTEDTIDVAKAKKILDDDHDGLEKPKDRILEYLAVKQLNPDLGNQIICLVGPPGTGKTSLGASIARAMNRKFVRVSLGGVRDEAEIRGHRKTYVAAMPGRIVTALTQAGSMNPVMLLDEIDKLCSDIKGDPSSALLEVLDGEQNKSFRDHFVEMPCDLSKVMFIATANTLDTIPRPLLDRMEIIELTSYTKNEKTAIAENHLIPKQLKRHGLTKRALRISRPVIEEIIDGYTRESGVRNLEREIASLCRKAARIMIETGKKSVSVTALNLHTFLGARKFLEEEKATANEIGVVNGLAYTAVGGDVLKVETTVMDGTGKLELTGTLGDVMKESAKIAVSYIRAHSDELGIPSDFYKTKDIHIHVPEGATPKDGPSAGVTMLSSLVSTLSGTPVRCDTAMTGELTLTGRVLPIGGLKEKTTAAWNAGIKRVIIPNDNVPDLDEIDPIVRQNLLFIPCKKCDQVLSEILVKSKSCNVKEVFDANTENTHLHIPAEPPRRNTGSCVNLKNKD